MTEADKDQLVAAVARPEQSTEPPAPAVMDRRYQPQLQRQQSQQAGRKLQQELPAVAVVRVQEKAEAATAEAARPTGQPQDRYYCQVVQQQEEGWLQAGSGGGRSSAIGRPARAKAAATAPEPAPAAALILTMASCRPKPYWR